MNPCLIELFESGDRLTRLTQGLPRAFEVVKHEMPPGNPAVGILRELVLSGFFLSEFGSNRVNVPDLGTVRSYDIEICGQLLSIKTSTRSTPPKVSWTMDSLKVGGEIVTYKPFCDIFLVQIYWGKERESVFYIPLCVQEAVHDEMGSNYLHVRVGGNNRGISITSEAMKLLRNHKETRRASVNWVEIGETPGPLDRWLAYWSSQKKYPENRILQPGRRR